MVANGGDEEEATSASARNDRADRMLAHAS
jgi:hypothetical protein